MTMSGTGRTSLRLGLVTPSSNTCLEPTTYQLLAGTTGVSAHFARVRVTKIALEESSDAQFSPTAMAAAAELLADAQVDSVVWNGTSGSWLGIGHDAEIAQRLTKVTGAPATTSTLALLEACAAFGVTRLGLVTPYTADVNEEIVRRYADVGLTVVAEDHLALTDNDAFAQVTPTEIAAQIRSVATGFATEVEAVAIMCTNVHGAPVVEQLERELGIPVFDSVSVSLWEALRLAGHHGRIDGFGTLLRDGSLRAGLQAVTQALLERTGADRTTLRIDRADHDLGVDLTAAESLRPGVRSIRRDSGLDQRRLNTVQWVETHRTDLVQPHFRADPAPPAALLDVYGVQAQMLGPIGPEAPGAGAITGWLSVHSLTERPWSPEDVAALDLARAEVGLLLDPRASAQQRSTDPEETS
jgi:maleate isomerase